MRRFLSCVRIGTSDEFPVNSTDRGNFTPAMRTALAEEAAAAAAARSAAAAASGP